MTRQPVLVLAILLEACGGASSTAPREEPSAEASPEPASPAAQAEPAQAEPRAAAPGSAASGPAASGPAAGGPAPVVALRGAPDSAGHVAITIENRGTEPARLSTRIEVIRADGTALQGVGPILLRDDCDATTEACVELVPGAALHPPDWLGTIGDAQCMCTRCVPAEPGSYRFVATSCDGAHRLEGEPFELGH